MHKRMLGVVGMTDLPDHLQWVAGRKFRNGYNIYQSPVGGLSFIKCSVDTVEEAEAMVAELYRSDLRFYNRFYWLKDLSAEEYLEGDEEQ